MSYMLLLLKCGVLDNETLPSPHCFRICHGKNISKHIDKELETSTKGPTKNTLHHQHCRRTHLYTIPALQELLPNKRREVLTVLLPYGPKILVRFQHFTKTPFKQFEWL